MRTEEIIKNLNQIHSLLEDDCPAMAKVRIRSLISEIKDFESKKTLWNILTRKG